MIGRSLRGEPATEKEGEGEVKEGEGEVKEGEVMEGEQKKEGEGEVKEGEVMEGEQKKEGEGEVMEGEEKKEGIITISDYEIDSDGSQDVEVNRIFER